MTGASGDQFVVVFTDYTDVKRVVGFFDTADRARTWALNTPEGWNQTWVVKQIEQRST